jgi:hypothetical protein
MRWLVVAVLIATTWTARAGDPAGGVGVDAIVPVDPHEHERLHFFDGSRHHLVPGAVSIDGKPYVCDADGKSFGGQDDFVAHLRSVHKVAPAAIPDRIVVRDGKVHFIKP